jgi:hypothetical protein
MKRSSLYISLAFIFLIVAFVFNAYFTPRLKEGHGSRRGSGDRLGTHKLGHGLGKSYPGDRVWVYGKGYYNDGHYWNNGDASSTDGGNSWIWWYPPKEEVIIVPYESLCYA